MSHKNIFLSVVWSNQSFLALVPLKHLLKQTLARNNACSPTQLLVVLPTLLTGLSPHTSYRDDVDWLLRLFGRLRFDILPIDTTVLLQKMYARNTFINLI